MFINKTRKYGLLLLVVLSVSGACSRAQSNAAADSTKRGKYAFVVYLGGGYSQYTANTGKPAIGLENDINRNSLMGTVRIMWHPDHRLRFGIESGWTNLYSYGFKNDTASGKLNLDAVPLLVVWSMAVTKRINVFAGFGSYLLTTKLNYKTLVHSRTFSLGVAVAASYVQPVSKKLGIGLQVEWMNAAQTRDAALNAQLQFVWKFLEW